MGRLSALARSEGRRCRLSSRQCIPLSCSTGTAARGGRGPSLPSELQGDEGGRRERASQSPKVYKGRPQAGVRREHTGSRGGV